jgi:GNAT superfamily N-acetyltransferase
VREPAPASPRPERDRAVAAVLARHAAAADRVEPWAGGRALLAPALPDLWDANHLILERPVDLDARRLASLAGRILGDGGARHRAVVVPDEAGAGRLAPGFADLGWDRDRLLLMALRGTPRPRPGGPEARELPPHRLAGLRRRMVLLEPWGSPGVAAQLEEHQRRLRAAFHSRCFAAPARGSPRASCELFCAGGMAEVADVGTLPDHRRRGLARAATVAAVGAARAAGAELVIVTADADDWPRDFYARLGFEPLGLIERFRRVGLEG